MPSIPPKDKHVPQGEDEDDNGPLSSAGEEDLIHKREQVIMM